MSTARLTWYLAAALLVYGAYAILSYPVHHDAGWFLYVAQVLLDGGTLNRDIVDVNPPLFIWFNMAFEAVARVTGVWNFTVHRLFVLAAAVVSWLLCVRVIRTSGWDLVPRSVAILLLGYLLIPFAGREFGQREHLATILTLPYLLSSAQQHDDSRQSITAQIGLGALAGIGFALKPYFLVPWLLVEAYLVHRFGWRSLKRPAHLTLLVVIGVYAGVVLLLSREYFEFARLFSDLYFSFGKRPILQLLVMPQALLAMAGLAAAIVAARTRTDAILPVLGMALAGFFIGVLVQRKGWDYHWIPSSIIALLVLSLLILRHVRFNARPAIVGSAVALLLLTTVTVRSGMTRYEELKLRPYRLPFMMELVESQAEDGPLAIFSTDLAVAFPLVNHTGVTWGLRFPCFWPLPLFYEPQQSRQFAYHTPDGMQRAERYIFESVLEDLTKHPPQLLIIDTAPMGYVFHGFDYLEYFGQDPRFGELLKSYRELPSLELFRVFKRMS